MLNGTDKKQAVGMIQISFSVDMSKEELLEDFCEFLVSGGVIKLENCDEQEVELEIHEIEYLDFDEYS